MISLACRHGIASAATVHGSYCWWVAWRCDFTSTTRRLLISCLYCIHVWEEPLGRALTVPETECWINHDLNCSSYWSHENKVQNRRKFLINLHWFSPWNWSWWCCTVKDIAGCHQQRGVSNIKFRSRLGKKTSWQGHRGEWYDVGHFWCRAMVIHNTLSQAVFVRCDGNKG